MVRVQAGRLRAKLAEYYSTEGAEDPIRVELPKGTYLLSFHHSHSAVPKAPANAPGPEQKPSTKQEMHATHAPRGWLIAVVGLSILLLFAIVGLFATHGGIPATVSGDDKAAPALAAFQIFWNPFLAGSDEPWVVFSNAAFVGRPETGMRYFNSARDAQDAVWDHYTGVGEVLAVHNLDQVFGMLHRNLRVKRGSLFSLDDAKNNDLIFVGSPSENLTLLEIPNTKEFVFQRVDSGPRKGDLAIAIAHPQSGESKDYLASPSNSPLTEDYAVVALVQGLNPARHVLIVAGTTTFGTQGAVEYICRQNSLEELLLRLSVSKGGEIKPFEALLRVKIARGVPVETELVSLRKLSLQ
jgi:hypothetical protein